MAATTCFLLVGLGGALGSMARYAVSLGALALMGPAFPWGTLAVNVLGSAAIALAAGAGLAGGPRLLLVTGFLGGFTTFSAFSLEAGMLAARAPLLALLYVGASVGLGLLAFAVTSWLMQN